jgi:hypothetical protein
MSRNRLFLIALILLLPVPGLSQTENTSSPTRELAGVVQSFSGNILDVKPAQTPAVWVTVPEDLHVDRSALKPGAEVSVEAHWAVACYVASGITVKK